MSISLGKYRWLSSCMGVELFMLPDNSYTCRVCEVSVKGNSLTIGAKKELSGDLASVLKVIPKGGALALTITGKGVLTRKTGRIEEAGEAQLNEIFPNLKSEQFYVENFMSGDRSFVSIARRDLVDELLTGFEKGGHEVLLCTIGPFASSHVIRQLNNYSDELCFDGHCLTYNKDFEWLDYRYEAGRSPDFPLKVGIDAMPDNFLICYASAFQLVLYPRLVAINIPVEKVENVRVEAAEKLRFGVRASLVLFVSFILLLLNFLLFSYYSSRNVTLLSQVKESSASIENIQDAERGISRNEDLLKQLGWNRGIRAAWLADRLGQSLPASLVLQQLAINPLNPEQSGRQRKEVYENGQIRIKGVTSDPDAVNKWLYALKESAWVKKVDLDSFVPRVNEEGQEFTITINY